MRDVGAEQLADPLDRRLRVFDDVVQQAGGDRHDVELHVGELVGDLERMHQIGLAGMAHLSLVLVGREHVGPPQQVNVGVGIDAPHFFDEVLEPNHVDWCLNSLRRAGRWFRLTWCFFVHYTGPVRQPAILLFVPAEPKHRRHERISIVILSLMRSGAV